MRVYDLIRKKKNKKPLTKEEIDFFINGVMDGSIKDFETTAFLMAVAMTSMTMDETYYLTMAMANSGEVMDFSKIKGVVVDKHSTGGVSDTTTLIVVPIVASLGLKVAKMSGGSLGFTGGTADKLKVFTGYNLNLTENEFLKTIQKVGASIISPNKNLAPADKILYELRNLTGSVESIPLIAASIMSKKIASGAQVIVLDVKFGNGAFMKTLKEATILAKTMVEIGKRAGRKVSAILTDMNEPLGSGIGTNLEVKNAISVLQGKKNNLATVSKKICEEILTLSGAFNLKEAKKAINDVIESGDALIKLQEIIRAHGGDDQLITRPELMQKPQHSVFVNAKVEGYVNGFQTDELGYIVVDLGGGKTQKTSVVDNSVGIKLFVKIGSFVNKGDKLAEIYYNDNSFDKIDELVERLQKNIKLSKNKKAKGKLIPVVIR